MSYHYKYNRTLHSFSQSNRKDQTDTERKLWFYLRNRQLKGYKFRRQYAINNYILDFYCVERKFAIELDGSQHMINEKYDQQRTNDLKKLGITVLRFWDNDVFQNTNAVLEKIVRNLELSANTTSS